MMAGSHTVMPGFIYKKTTVLNLVSASSTIGSNNSGLQYTIVRPVAGGAVNLNGHSNNLVSTATILKPIGKTDVQPSSNNVSYVLSHSNNLRSPSTLSYCQINSNGASTRESVHTSNQSNINLESVVTKNVEVVGLPAVLKESPEPTIKEEIEEVPEEEEEEPVIDIVINNVVGSFSVACHLDLRNIALSGKNVEFRKENGMVTMKLRRPLTTASIWSSGKITCTGSTSEEQARVAARRVARCLQNLGYNTRFRNFRVVNVLGTCTMPFAIKISQFSQCHRNQASYEPELHPGVTYRIPFPKATLKIFSTGSITVTAPCVNNVQNAIETIYPLVKEFSKPRTQEELLQVKKFKPAPDKDEEDMEVAVSGDEAEEDVV